MTTAKPISTTGPASAGANASSTSALAMRDDVENVTDKKGRLITIREPDIIPESRLVRNMGDYALNAAYMANYVMIAAMVIAIDGQPCEFPTSPLEVEVAIKQIGRDGMNAVMRHLVAKEEARKKAEGKTAEAEAIKN